MGVKLCIVESPSKARKIQGYLGDGWRVQASVGHIRDLPAKPDDGLGVDLSTFRPQYVVTNKRAAKALKDAARGAETIILATDPDREGEAIAWHIAVLLGLKNPPRACFNEITPTTVRAALSAPRNLDMALVAAQETRRVLDRLVGYLVSGTLTRGLTAGRVQSPGLRLVVERERAITAFQVTKHYGVRANDPQGRFAADWDTRALLPDDAPYWRDRAAAERVAGTQTLIVVSTDHSTRVAKPPKPFWTSTLQQAASSQLKLRPDDTMKAAQALYEEGHITYLRTDSPHIAKEAQEAIRAYLTQHRIPVPVTPTVYKARAGAQEAHEAIRPTRITVKEAGESESQRRLYRLIRLRTLASQMMPARYDVSTAALDSAEVDVSGAPARFQARGEALADPGWTRAGAVGADPDKDGDDAAEDDAAGIPKGPLPPMTAGQRFPVHCDVLVKETKPPPRYTEASLTGKLEHLGIGRPSTYAAIVGTMSKRGYADLKALKLYATQRGCDLIDTLAAGGFSFLDYDYTKILEESLDRVAAGAARYRETVAGAYNTLRTELDTMPEHLRARGEPDPNAPCPDCQRPMRWMRGERGTFWGCSGYPKCKTTLPDDDGKPGQARPRAAPVGRACPDCGAPLVTRTVRQGAREGQSFVGCSGYPACRYVDACESGAPLPHRGAGAGRQRRAGAA